MSCCKRALSQPHKLPVKPAADFLERNMDERDLLVGVANCGVKGHSSQSSWLSFSTISSTRGSRLMLLSTFCVTRTSPAVSVRSMEPSTESCRSIQGNVCTEITAQNCEFDAAYAIMDPGVDPDIYITSPGSIYCYCLISKPTPRIPQW